MRALFITTSFACIVGKYQYTADSFSLSNGNHRRQPVFSFQQLFRRNIVDPSSSAATTNRSTSTCRHYMAPSGMGMTKTKTKKGGSNSSGGNSKGMGKKSSTDDTKFDVAKSWTKLQKSYDEVMSESNTNSKTNGDDDEWDESTMEITTEYIVTARCKSGSSPSSSSASSDNTNNSAYRSSSDWIPVAQVCIVRPIHMEETEKNGAHHKGIATPPQATISYYCREISYAATLAAPILKSLPRNLIEYGYEPIDSFMKFVYGDVITGKTADSYVNGDNEKVKMTKSNARQILQLEEGCIDAALIKRSYKKLSMAYHPDRFINSDKTKEEIEESTHQFTLVKMAYEALNSGVRSSTNGSDGDGVVNGDDGSSSSFSTRRSSWYESLGGKSRTEFVGPIELLSSEKASALCNKAFKCGVIGLDQDITMAFVVRNHQAAATTTSAR
jgi:hypothetical protein